MIYDLSKDLDRARFSTRVKKLWEERSKVELKKKFEIRTIPLNRYLHLILSWFALETGYTTEQVKQDIYKRQVCKKWYAIEKNGRTVYRSSADLDNKEMVESIEFFRNFSASDLGIYLPAPNEEENLRSIEEQIGRYGNSIYI